MPAPEEIQARLAELVLSDPRQARTLLLDILDRDVDSAEALLRNLAGPENSRLRSLVANISRGHSQKQRLIPFMLKWRDAETDEFTRRAIQLALSDVDERQYSGPATSGQSLPAQAIELYRYISDRLKHRVRNATFGAQAYVTRLKALLGDSASSDVTAALARLTDAMLTVERALEATDADPQYFKQRPVAIVDWLRQMNVRYAVQYPAIRLVVETKELRPPVILGSDYLLETIFWNLWTNAHQALGKECEISVFVRRSAGIELVVLDNGDGFSEKLVGIAFSQQYSSSNSAQRGRGLLEVGEAVDRLGGSVTLFPYEPGNLRIKIILPEAEI